MNAITPSTKSIGIASGGWALLAADGPCVLVVRLIALGWAALAAAFFTVAVVARYKYPIELEWMGGAVLDHIDRVRAGTPIYAEPSSEFIAFLYPPFYYYVVAACSHASSTLWAARTVSVVATIGTVLLMPVIARRLGVRGPLAGLASGLYLSAYSYTGFWYDTERADSLLVLLLLAATFLLMEGRSVVHGALAGLLFAVAFFTKQPALVIGGVTIAIALAVAPRTVALAALAMWLTTLLAGTLWLNHQSGGWFWFYCITLPRSHGFSSALYTLFLVSDASDGFLFSLATLFAAGVLIRGLRTQIIQKFAEPVAQSKRQALVFSAAVVAAFASSGASRFHVGGFKNVLMFWVAFACVAAPWALVELGRALPKPHARSAVGVLLALLPVLQMARFTVDPSEAVPSAARQSNATIVETRIRELERHGDVVVHGRGHLTSTPHFHAAALMDVLRANQAIPASIRDAITSQHYAAYVIDEFGELSLEAMVGHRSELWALVNRYYFVAERFDDREPPPVVGWIAHPSWVYRPRRLPVRALDDKSLETRLTLERGIAENRMRERQAGILIHDRDGLDIELEAQTLALPAN